MKKIIHPSISLGINSPSTVLGALYSLIHKTPLARCFVRFCFLVVYHERAKRVEWRCGELDPGPNPSMKVSLRRVVSVIFKAGCEERRRNHSYPIPYLDVLGGRPDIDLTEYST